MSFGREEILKIDPTNSVQLMKAMIDHFNNTKMTKMLVIEDATDPPIFYRYSRWNRTTKYRYDRHDDQHTTLQWTWVGEDLILDNYKVAVTTGKPVFQINKYFALQMGWFEKDIRYVKGKRYELIKPGNNLIPVYRYNHSPADGQEKYADLKDDNGVPLLWKEVNKGQDIQLSVWCDWHFHNLNEAFSKFRYGCVNKTLFVYCDVIASSMVGDQEKEFLREIKCQMTESHSFEPLRYSIYSRWKRCDQHYQDLCLRSKWRANKV